MRRTLSKISQGAEGCKTASAKYFNEQSASSAERHRCCLHLQASLKVWTLLSSLRRFDDYFNRCWTLRLIALLIDVFYWRCVCCLHF